VCGPVQVPLRLSARR